MNSDFPRMTALGWKELAEFCKRQAETERQRAPVGKVVQEKTQVTLRIDAGHGITTADKVTFRPLSWQSIAVALAGKVNAETLAKVVEDYNAGTRLKPDSLPTATRLILEGCDRKQSTRKGSIRHQDGCFVREGSSVMHVKVV